MKSKKTTILGFVSAGTVLTLMTVFFVNVNAVETRKEESDKIVSPLAEEADEICVDADVVLENEVVYEYVFSDDTVPPEPLEEADEICDDADPIFENEVIYVDGFADDTVPSEPSEEAEAYEVTTVEMVEYECIGISEDDVSVLIPVEFDRPLDVYGDITGEFGYHTNPVGVTVFNKGINISARFGTPVKAVADGTVTYVDYDHESGIFVTVDHGNGFITGYGHLSATNCQAGDKLSMGDKLGEVGATGKVTGPNLLFTVELQGCYIDPSMLVE